MTLAPWWAIAAAAMSAPPQLNSMMTGSLHCVTRRRTLCLAGAAALSTAASNPARVNADTATTAAATITDKVRLEFVQQVSAEESLSLPITIGLFGKDAPQAVSAFKATCAGELAVPCPAEVDVSGEVMERSKQSKKAALRACLGSEGAPVSYAYSTIWSIQRGKRIDAGQVQGKYALRLAPSIPPNESAALTHDAAGLLSVRRGGGSFDFGITTAPTPEFDEDFIVIGRVIDGMDSVEVLDRAPVVKAADGLNVEGPRTSRASACEYSNPQPFCAQNKPLKKVMLLRSAVL